MENNKTDLQHYIALSVKKELDDDSRKIFYHVVKKNLPEGILTSLPIVHPKKGTKHVRMIREELDDDKGSIYKIVLSRDLTEREIQPIFEQLAEELDAEIDFELEGSGEVVDDFDTSSYYDLPDYKKRNVAEKISKYLHQRWMQDRADEGWRYGVERDEQQKTHPMLRGWDDLPEAYRTVDPDLPGVILDALADEGFFVVSEQEYYSRKD